MLAIVQSAVLAGIASYPVRVEVQAVRGIPTFELVGLAEAAVRESRVLDGSQRGLCPVPAGVC